MGGGPCGGKGGGELMQPYYVQVAPVRQTSGMAVASMVLGILGVVSGCCTFGVFSLLAVLFGHVGMNETKDGSKAGHGMAVAGLVMGYVFVAPMLVLSIMGGIGAITPTS